MYYYFFFMYSWSQVGSLLSPSTLVVTEWSPPFLPGNYIRSVQHIHWHWTERYMGLLARQPDNWLPHSASLSTLTIMMAISCNHAAWITHAYHRRDKESNPELTADSREYYPLHHAPIYPLHHTTKMFCKLNENPSIWRHFCMSCMIV